MSLLLLLTFLGFVPTPAQAAIISPITVEYSSTTAELVLLSYAAKYHLKHPDRFVATAKCESGFDAAVGGDFGTSWGVFQIHLSAHEEITKKQATDPWFAIDWAAKQFAAGREHMWSCYNNKYGPDTS